MRIAVITDYACSGGASIAATRLCCGLKNMGHYIGRFYYFPPAPPAESSDANYPITHGTQWVQQLSTHVQNEAWRWLSQKFWVKAFRKSLGSFKPDIIHLHNLHGANWDMEIVAECLRHAPVVWTMHDMWPLTGSCAHSFECKKYLQNCDSSCPQVGVYPTLPRSMIARAHRRRQNFYDKRPKLRLVAPSRWLEQIAKEMTRGRVPVYRISNGLNLDTFRAVPKDWARSILRIPNDSLPCILASASSLSNKNKGMALLLEALSELRHQPLRLLLMGHDDAAIRESDHLEIIRLGPLSGERLLPVAYCASDLFVHPSIAENQPLVIMEAMACGVPCVALPSGGIPEMIKEGETGWLASEKSASSLASAIRNALSHQREWTDISANCRRYAEHEFAVSLASERYNLLYRAILSNSYPDQIDLDGLSANLDANPLEQTLCQSNSQSQGCGGENRSG